MRVPTSHIEINLNGPSFELSVDSNRRLGEVGPGPTIPVAELDDLDFFAAGSCENLSKFTTKPLRLKIELDPLPRSAERKLAFRTGRNVGSALTPHPGPKGFVAFGSGRESWRHLSMITFILFKIPVWF